MKKIDRLKIRIKHWPGLFRCTVCDELLIPTDDHRLQCRHNHSFDLSKKGYVNLLSDTMVSSYDNSMLEARNRVFHSGLFDPLSEEIDSLSSRGIGIDSSSISILDAGCGEGSFLQTLVDSLTESDTIEVKSVGLDISKPGIQIASRKESDIIWCVGDIARMPLESAQFNLLLNILSPANYKEFGRVLKKTGRIIKVIPGQNHLQEIRSSLYRGQKSESYNPEEVIRHSKKYLTDVHAEHIRNRKVISKDQLCDIITMAPLAWNMPEHLLDSVRSSGIKKLTTEFVILCGRVKRP